MATVEQKIRCERRVRELLAAQGLPEPSFVEYGYTCIRVYWVESKLVLRIDIDDEATTEHVILVDVPHPSQPPIGGDEQLHDTAIDPVYMFEHSVTTN